MNSRRGADVLHQATDVARQAAAGNFAIGDELYELVFSSGWINGRYHLDCDSLVIDLGQYLAEMLYRDRLVTFDGDVAHVHIQRVH